MQNFQTLTNKRWHELNLVSVKRIIIKLRVDKNKHCALSNFVSKNDYKTLLKIICTCNILNNTINDQKSTEGKKYNC